MKEVLIKAKILEFEIKLYSMIADNKHAEIRGEYPYHDGVSFLQLSDEFFREIENLKSLEF